MLGSANHDEQQIGAMVAQAQRIGQTLDATDTQIAANAAAALTNVKAALERQKSDIEAYKKELAEQEAQSKTVGGTVLGQSFRDVKAKFYDVIVRADIGNIDVSWSRRQASEDELKRLTLQEQREAKQISDEFRGLLDEEKKQQAQPPPPQPTPPPAGGGGQ
jgi:hypothetical protein